MSLIDYILGREIKVIKSDDCDGKQEFLEILLRNKKKFDERGTYVGPVPDSLLEKYD